MIFFLAAFILGMAPVISLIIWNGVHGHGYIMHFRLPARESKYHVWARIGYAVYGIAIQFLAVVGAVQIFHTNEGDFANDALLIIFYFVVAPGLIVTIRLLKDRNK